MIQNRNYNRERSSMTDWIMTDLNRDKLIKEVHEETAKRIGRHRLTSSTCAMQLELA